MTRSSPVAVPPAPTATCRTCRTPLVPIVVSTRQIVAHRRPGSCCDGLNCGHGRRSLCDDHGEYVGFAASDARR